MKLAPMTAIFVSSCGVFVGGCGTSSAMYQRDLGEVNPGQQLKSSITITNPFPTPATVSGIDGACGVHALNGRNGVLLGRESMSLDLASIAPRLPGPGGFKLDINFEAGKKKKIQTYLFSFSVRAHPFLDRNQVWLVGDSPVEVHLYGCEDDVKIGLQAPSGVVAAITGRSVTIRGAPKFEFSHVVAQVLVSVPGAPPQQLPLDLFRGIDPLAPRVYPSSVWMAGRTARAALVNVGPGVAIRTAPGSRFRALRRGSSLELSRNDDSEFEGRLELVDRQGRVVTTSSVSGPKLGGNQQ